MPVKMTKLFKDGSPILVSVRSIIAIIITITLAVGAISGGMDWQDFKEIALIVFTYFFTVKHAEDNHKRGLLNGSESKT